MSFKKIRINNRKKIINYIKKHKKWDNQFMFIEVPKKMKPSYMVFPILLSEKYKKFKVSYLVHVALNVV